MRGLLIGAEFFRARHCLPPGGRVRGVDRWRRPRNHEALVAAHGAGAPAPVGIDRDDPAWFFFTSGTTARLKAAVLIHGQFVFAIMIHLSDAIANAVADVGADAAWLRIRDVDKLSPAFFGPAPAPDYGHAVWYSATTRLAPARVVEAVLRSGQCDGEPYQHGHGMWIGPGGFCHSGHLLIAETKLTAPALVGASLIESARF